MTSSAGDERLRERLRAERDERRRLAELLHDGPVQHVAALVQMTSAVAAALEASDLTAARTVAARAEQVAREAATELRDVVTGIDPAALEREGLAAVVRQLAGRTTERTGIAFQLDLPAAGGLGEGAASGLYQVIREAVDQAARRGPPERIAITLTETERGGIALTIVDDGAAERRQAVIDGLAERATELNGTLEASREGTATTVIVTLPPSAARL